MVYYLLRCISLKTSPLECIWQAASTPSTSNSGKQARLTDLDSAQKEAISNMTKPSDLDYSERKRQYSSLRRAIQKEANPALVAKFQMANDSERFFGLY